MAVKNFKDLVAWQKAMDLPPADFIYIHLNICDRNRLVLPV
jgi:hypothetical protein